MKVLLDTHTFLWFIMGNSKLSEQARSIIEDLNNQRLISIASLWEMAIKISSGKLTIPSQPFEAFMRHQLEINCIEILSMQLAHTALVSTLPFPNKHRDPFDRMIIAQSIVNHIPIIGRDSDFDDYLVERIW